MDYVATINQYCPVEIQVSVAQLENGVKDAVEDAAFHDLTSMPLELSCAAAVTWYLAENLTTQKSVGYRTSFKIIAGRYVRDFKAAGPQVFQPIQEVVARAMRLMLNDVQVNSTRGSMLSLLAHYEINFLDEIRVRTDDRVLGKGFFADWQLNEYALCMGDLDAVARLRQTIERAGAQDLRQTYTSLRWSNICIPSSMLAELVRPSLSDNRVTSEVSGNGPPVSHYARELLDAL